MLTMRRRRPRAWWSRTASTAARSRAELTCLAHPELHEALEGRRGDDTLIAVKFGSMRSPDGGFIGIDCRTAAVKNFLAYTLRRLGTDYVDLYQPARVDPAVPIEETVGAIKEMIEAGYVRHLGLSEVGADTLRRAHAIRPVACLQIEYSLISRGIEAEILPTAREFGIGIGGYGVLSRGLLSGHWTTGRGRGAPDYRAHLPRFIDENLERNLEPVEALRGMAGERRATVAQIAIAWVLAQGDDILPLIGARQRDRLAEALGALDLELSAADLARIERAVPAGAATGDRYDARGMAMLDSERGRQGVA